MPLTATRSHTRPRRYLITLLCALVPILSGLAILYMQAERTLAQHTRR